MAYSMDLTKITGKDLQAIKEAKTKMENLNWSVKAVNALGSTVEFTTKVIPEKALNKIQKGIENTLLGIIKANLLTISKNKKLKKPSKRTYKLLITGSGAASGFFGSTTGWGTAIFVTEMAMTTKFLMRSIMDIARSEGEDIYSLEGQMQCLQVFAMGGKSIEDDETETGYYTSRAALSGLLKKTTASGIQAVLETTAKSSAALGSKTLTKFISKIAARFSAMLTEKFVAEAIPIVGAVGGATINYVFINHYQKMASAHFTLRRLERKYSEALVKQTYESL